MADNVVDVLLRARMDASDISSGVGSIQKALNGLSLPKNISGDLEKGFAKVTPLLKDYQKQLEKMGTGSFTQKDVKNLSLLREKINDTLGDIKSKIQETNGQEIRLKTDDQEIAKLEKQLDGLQNKLSDKLSNIFKKGQTESSIKQGIKGITDTLNATFSSGKFKFPALRELTSDLKEAFKSQDYASFNNQLDTIKNKITGLSDANKIAIGQSLAKTLNLDKTVTDVSTAKKVIDDFFASVTVNRTSANGIDRLNTQITDLQAVIAQTKTDALTRGFETLGNSSSGIDQLISSINGVQQSTDAAAGSILTMQQQVGQLKTSTQYFFSLRNMINLLQRGIRGAIDTVKDLDKAMTETAVVTKFSVSDMWGKLPEYTRNANALGATVQDMYEATTLYYQQGLNTEQAMSIAAETMKMARIGGLEAADATDKMTAALRGFNMEINETSAQRINDVYSNLAAKTASNTEELGTAMQRTASIANSAGMSFEGTAAFLAQAIETTREPAENLGTAMKTIVARFQELKKNPLEITDVEGEEVSYNKVDTALQSIGVSLKDTNGQFRDLDQVFLDIAQRWDNLTQTQQRYVATTAAGSRQQSRFIAMMSNYERTTQLMDYANNAEGASAEQFNKTLDSLEAKLNKFQNAWKEFLMGITNSNMIKGAVDGLTYLLDKVNMLINALSLGQGPLKTIISLFTAFTGLKMGGRILNSLIGGLGGLVDPNSSFGAGLKSGAIGSKSGGNPIFASQIYTPIVNAINQLKGSVDKSAAKTFTTPQQVKSELFKNARSGINSIYKEGGQFSVRKLNKQLYGLGKGEENALINTNKKLFNNAMTAALKTTGYGINGNEQGYLQNKEGLLKAGQFLNEQRKAGVLTATEYYKALQDPALLREALKATPGGQAGMYKGTVEYLNTLNDGINQATEQKIQEAKDSIDKNNKIKDKEAAKERVDAQRENIRGGILAQQHQGDAGDTPKRTFWQGVSNFGDGVRSAGMSLSAFGSLLQQSTNPAVQAFGTVLTSLGGIISTAGMAISGLSGAVTAVVGVIGAVPAAIALAVAALIGGAYVWKKVQEKQIKERAEKITSNYKEKSSKSESNITNLNSWKTDLARLSKGVDRNGNNINLDTSDYQRYLEIVDGIAEINPEIVKGYNAQGHAIIDNNTALEKTLELEKNIQKNTLKEYIDDDSIKALVEARDLNKVTKADVNESWRTVGKSKALKERLESDKVFAPQAKMAEQAKKMVQSLKDAGLSNKDFKDFGINLDALELGDQAAISALERNLTKFTTRAKARMEEAGDEVADSTKEAFDKSIGSFSKAADEMDELITPLYDALSTKMANEKAFQNIPDDMVTYFNQGLKTIASDANLSSTQMISKARDLSNEFVNLIEKGGDYDAVMSQIAEAQEKFGENLDTAAYDKAADKATTALEKIKKGIDSTSSYAPALTEFLDNQIAQIASFTEEGAANVTDALNTMTDEIASAEGALENFKKVEEGSNFTTAANNMKEIFETITDKESEHAGGKGDQTYWAGAEALLGRDFLEKKGTDKKVVDQMLKNMKPLLQEGEKGWNAFKERWFKAYDEGKFKDIKGLKTYENGWLKSWDTDLNADVFKEMAEALQMSEDSLTAMLNKGRQFGSIDFTNLKEVREGLATSDSVIQGQPVENGKRKIYIKKEALNAELAQAGITNVSEQKTKREQLAKEQGIKVITEAAKIGIKEFQDMGIHSQESLIAVLDDTGQFTKQEIQEYAEAYSKADKNAAEFNKQDFDEAFRAHEAIKDPVSGEQLKSLKDIDTSVASIAEMMATQQIREGHLNKQKAKETEEMLFGGKGVDTEAQLFATGKNQKGEIISPKDYKETYKDLGNFVTETQTYLEQLKEGRGKTKAGSEERKKYDDEIKRFEYMLERAQFYQGEGRTAYHKANNDKIAALNDKTGGLLEGKTWKDFKGSKAYDLQQLYESTIEPKEVTDSFVESLHNVGIKLKQALGAGLVTEESYDAYRKKAKAEKKKQNQEERKGEDEANKEDNQLDKQKAKEDQQKRNESKRDGEDEANKEEPKKRKQSYNGASASGDAFDQYSAEEAEQAGANIRNSLKNFFGVFKSDKWNKNLVGTENTETKYTIETDDKELDKTKKKVDETSKEVEKPHKYGIKVDNSGLVRNPQIAKAEKKDKTIKVNYTKGKVDEPTTGVNRVVNYTKGKVWEPPKTFTRTVNYNVGTVAEVPQQEATLKLSLAEGSKNLRVSFAAMGMNQNYSTDSFSVGSLASGTQKPKHVAAGRIGPNGNGGLTLTGELGYEVAWLPSEGRSMILGVNGPEMVNLPGNAVVWNHEQSKQIVKKGAIHGGSAAIGAGSMGGKDGSSGTSGKEERPNLKNGTTKPKKKKKTDKKEKVDKNNSDKTKKLIAQWTKWSIKVGRITNWWENISRKVEASQKRTDQNQKRLQKLLTKVGTTISDIGIASERYRQSISATIKVNNEIFKKYTQQLFNFNNQGAKKGTIRKYNDKAEQVSKLQSAIDVAGKGNKVRFNGKTISYKSAKSKLKKLKKSANNAKNKATEQGGVQVVSWDDNAIVTTKQTKKTKKNKKGKTVVKRKKTKVKRSAAIDFSELVRYDPETGAYVADTEAINRIATGKNGKTNKKKAEAIKKKANEYIDTATQRRNDAYEKMISAGEALEEQAKSIYEQFYGWKNELTKIYELTRKITALEAHRSKLTAAQELNQSRLTSGLALWEGKTNELISNSLQLSKAQITLSVEAIKKGMDLINSSTSKLIGEKDQTTGKYSGGLINRDAAQVLSEINSLPQQEELKEYTDALKAREEAEKKALEANNAFLQQQASENIEYEKAVENRNKKQVQLNTNKNKIASNKKEIKDLQADLKKEKKGSKKYKQIKNKIDKLKKQNNNLSNSNSVLNKEISTLESTIEVYEKYAKTAENANNALLAADAAVAAVSSKLKPETLGKYLGLKDEYEARNVLGQFLDFDSIQVLGDGTVNYDFDTEKFEEAHNAGEINDATYEKIKEILDEIDNASNELSSQIQEEISRVNEMYQQLKDLKETYAGYARELLDSYEEMQQEDLDNRQKLFDTLNKNLKDLLDEVKRRLEQRRQAEDNAKTESDIAKKQQRLATLQADTSGGKASEIKQLQQEIAEAQQGYGRTLEDQLLERLQEQGDDAEKQRERQIEIMQAQLDLNKVNGNNIALIEEWLSNPAAFQTEIQNVWEHAEEFGKKLGIEKELSLAEWKEVWESFYNFREKRNDLENGINVSEETIKTLNTRIEEFCNTIENLKNLNNVNNSENTNNSETTNNSEPKEEKPTGPSETEQAIQSIQDSIRKKQEALDKAHNRYAKELSNYETAVNKRSNYKKGTADWNTWQNKAIVHKQNYQDAQADITRLNNDIDNLRKQLSQYKSGGMNYTTGPAWLDGTRAKPEAVLNATETKNFIALKDILSDVMGHIDNTNSTTYGDSTWEININVDHLNNDYDVDKVAKRVEKIITDNASYRNVTMVRKFR